MNVIQNGSLVSQDLTEISSQQTGKMGKKRVRLQRSGVDEQQLAQRWVPEPLALQCEHWDAGMSLQGTVQAALACLQEPSQEVERR